MAEYLPRKFVAHEAERVNGSDEQAKRLGIIFAGSGVVQCEGPKRWATGRIGDWLVRSPDGHVEFYQDRVFHAMFQEVTEHLPPDIEVINTQPRGSAPPDIEDMDGWKWASVPPTPPPAPRNIVRGEASQRVLGRGKGGG